MSRFAAMMMFTAWLLYGAMPAIAMPASGAMPTAAETVQAGMKDHSHHAMTAAAAVPGGEPMAGARGETQNPCPHGSGKTCMAPFCAACLVLLPDIAFTDAGRFVHAHPAPQAGPVLQVSAARPPTPPPRA